MIHRFSINSPKDFTSVRPSNRSEVEQTHPQLQIEDYASQDILITRQLVDELINVAGALIQVYARSDSDKHDRVWQEDSDPTYLNPITIKAFFKPQPLEAELKKWGVQTENKTELVFSHRQLYEHFQDRMLRAGDVVKIPYNAASDLQTYKIINATPSGNFRYNWLYFTCTLTILQADITVRPEHDIQNPMNIPDERFYG